MGKGRGGKLVAGLFGFGLGAFNPGWFNTGSWFVGGLYGASLASNIWLMSQKPEQQDNYSRFDQMMNTTSSDAVIPVIYGRRKWAGMQTYHNPSSDKRSLTKDIVLCEGDIESVTEVKANDLYVSTQQLFTFQYTGSHQYGCYSIDSNTLVLYEIDYINNSDFPYYKIIIKNTKDVSSYTIGDVCSYINSITGWVATAIDIEFPMSQIAKSNNVSGEGIAINPNGNCKTPVTIAINGLPNCSYVTHTNGAEIPDNYEDVGSYRGMVWLRANLAVSDQLTGGNPNITAIIQGRKVKYWDGSSWQYGFSDNPAWCVRDFLVSKQYGCGLLGIEEYDLDDESFKEVADYCDTIISYKVPTQLTTVDQINTQITNLTNQKNNTTDQTIQDQLDAEIARLTLAKNDVVNQPVTYTIETSKRYTMNIILDQSKNAIEHLIDMFTCFGGFIVFTSDNKISLRVEKAEIPAYHFDEKTIIYESVQFSTTSIDDVPNQYKIGFFDPNNEWTQVKVLVEDYEDQHTRNRLVTKEVTLLGCTSQSQAIRVGQLYMKQNKMCPVAMQFSTGSFAMHLEPGDVIEVTYQNIFAKMPFRIQEVHESNGIYTLHCQQYNESIYSDAIDAELVHKDYTEIPKTRYATVENPIFTGTAVLNDTPVATHSDIPTTLPANGGRSDTADKLTTPVTINDVTFDGSNNISITKVNNQDIATVNQIPTTLPANGGNAASVGGIFLRLNNGNFEISSDNTSWHQISISN